MPLAIGQNENILFPVPYAENEANPLVITNRRVVHRTEFGTAELGTGEIQFVARHTVRPYLVHGAAAALVALLFAGYGAFELYRTGDMKTAPWSSLLSGAPLGQEGEAREEAPPPSDEPAAAHDWGRELLVTRLVAYAALAAGAAAFVGARTLFRKERFSVLVRGRDRRLLRLPAKSAIDQGQIMVTLAAVQPRPAAPAR